MARFMAMAHAIVSISITIVIGAEMRNTYNLRGLSYTPQHLCNCAAHQTLRAIPSSLINKLHLKSVALQCIMFEQ